MPDFDFLSLQARGKMRRFIQSKMFRQEAEANIVGRQGECRRCGACCKILFRCPFLGSDSNGHPTCRIYDHRFTQCRLFPIHARDLAEVKRVCGFTFKNAARSVASNIPAAATE